MIGTVLVSAAALVLAVLGAALLAPRERRADVSRRDG
jgi:hypothetical protein